MRTGDPIFPLWGSDGFSPGGIVPSVDNQFEQTCFNVREKDINGTIEVQGKIEWKEIMCVAELRKFREKSMCMIVSGKIIDKSGVRLVRYADV